MTQMKRKVFGIGWGKTGTCTLNRCFKRFGLTCAGFNEKLLRQVCNGNPKRALACAGTRDSVVNYPWSMIYRELDAEYPGSKFVLTVRRDATTWVKSATIHEKRKEKRGRKLHASLVHAVYGVYTMVGNEKLAALTYCRHNSGVLEYFAGRIVGDVEPAKADLLVACWETGTTFAELAAFLDLSCPRGKIPHIHWDESSGVQRPSIIGSLPPGV